MTRAGNSLTPIAPEVIEAAEQAWIQAAPNTPSRRPLASAFEAAIRATFEALGLEEERMLGPNGEEVRLISDWQEVKDD